MHEMLIRKVVKVNRNIKDLRDILLKVLKIGGEKVMESEFLTVKEFAERAGVSVQSVYQRLNKSLKPYLKVVKGVKYIDSKALMEVYGLKVEQDIKQGFKGSEEHEKDISEQVIDLLREELKKKDEQISKLMQLVDQEQRLLAAEQQKYLKVKEELEEQQNKKSWWQFWK